MGETPSCPEKHRTPAAFTQMRQESYDVVAYLLAIGFLFFIAQDSQTNLE
jgi:hypothetical protein